MHIKSDVFEFAKTTYNLKWSTMDLPLVTRIGVANKVEIQYLYYNLIIHRSSEY